MVASVPAEISKLLPRLPAAALRRPLPPPATHYPVPSTLLCALCLPRASRGAPVSATSVLRFSPSSGTQARQLSCLHRFAASLSSLCALFCIRFLYFQQLAASFHKTPGWGVPRFPFQPPTAHYPLLTTHSPLPALNSFASYHIPATPAVSCSYALFCATARRYPLPFQALAHSFHRHGVYPPPVRCPLLAAHYPLSRLEA
jgi:hypothetical protein